MMNCVNNGLKVKMKRTNEAREKNERRRYLIVRHKTKRREKGTAAIGER
ncbi:Protein CBG26302 [Caenorhabditis briggsae]|uniref:Protein CBG26302 n=1 Tax=Caenorhabditis briggsae TaxID=6238 RepID=B6IG75_CAEBR|nr:Protein CBG26302 [Caenorhabditis briggsae]CAR98905.1 Protein CBG26302 [Caenorhabditis briggsae]